MNLRQTALALALLSASLFVPSAARATPSDLDGDPFTGMVASGSSPDGAEFLGTMEIQDFVNRDGQLVALGTLSGQVTSTDGTRTTPVAIVDDASVEVPVGSVLATCERLHLSFGPVPLDLQTSMIQVAPIRIDNTDPSADGAMTRERLCTLAGQFQEAPGLCFRPVSSTRCATSSTSGNALDGDRAAVRPLMSRPRRDLHVGDRPHRLKAREGETDEREQQWGNMYASGRGNLRALWQTSCGSRSEVVFLRRATLG